MRGAGRFVVAAALVLGVILVGGCTRTGGVKTYRGVTTAVDVQGVGVGLRAESGTQQGFVVGNGVEWRAIDGSWHSGDQPECLPPLSKGATVSIEVVHAHTQDAVVSVRCDSLPTEVYWAGERDADAAAPPSAFVSYCRATTQSLRPIAPRTQDPCSTQLGTTP